MPHPLQKNIVHGTIHANGNVHIGDIIYNIARDFKSGSILFLRLDKKDGTHYEANLSIKSKHSDQGNLASSGEKWCENIEIDIPTSLFDELANFQTMRRSISAPTRIDLGFTPNGNIVAAAEHHLSTLIYNTFFAGQIGAACTAFIQLLEEQRIEELLLAISADDETIVNLPFEMALPLLFPPKLGEAKKSLAISNFGLVRTKISSLEAFNLQGDHASAAPLKMLFITALPENLDEHGKMLQIEEEQTRLIRAIGALEATGDKQPKIVIEFLENASLTELDKALHARQHDIVHISGHGAYHAAQNKGVLYFENEDGDEEQVSGAALGETLRQHACVKLLILSACETAIAGSEGGVTEQVAAYGIPSIVAMRFAVTDEGAKVFTTELYTQLAKGLSLTRALAYAREALLQDIAQRREQAPHILHIAEWFTPVVYQNQAVGALIDKTVPYDADLLKNFYPLSSFLKTRQSRLIGEGFIGRKRYLIQLRQAFRAGRHVCLYGLGGLGKTTLAEAFAHNYDNHSYTTLIFRKDHQINEAHILQILNKRFAKINPELAEQVQQTIDDPQTEVLEKLQLLIDNYLLGRKTILIFDNAEDVQTDEGGAYQRSIGSESLSAFLKHLCTNTPDNCHILFTTRYKIEDLADVLVHLPLDKMGYAEQYRLLNYSETLRTIPLKERDDVYKRLDGHPRGYEYLEALLKKDKSFSWQQVSQAEAEVFENLLLAKVYERLTKREKAIFQMAAVFITRSPLAALAAVSDEVEVDLIPLLQALQDWSLCFVEKDGRFEVHRLTREWMAQQVIDPAKVKEWALQAGEYFKSQLTLILAKNYFELAEAWEQFADTSFSIQAHYQLIGLYQQAFELNQAVLEKNIDAKTNAIALNSNGAILFRVSDYDTGLPFLEQSLDIMQQIGDRKGEGVTLNNISQFYYIKGDYDSALNYLTQSLAIQQQIGDRQGEGATLGNISKIYDAKGDYDSALLHSEQSLVITQQIGDRQGEGAAFHIISQIYGAKGDYYTELYYLEQSLAIQQQIGDRQGEGTTLNNIGENFKRKGDYENAFRYLEQSLAIKQEIGDRQGEGLTLNNIGQIYKFRGNYDAALNYYERSLKIRQQIGDLPGEGTTLNDLGTIALAKSNLDTALLYLEQSLAIRQQIGDRQGEGTTLNNLAATALAKGNPDSALNYLEQSLDIQQQIGDRQGEGVTLNNLASTASAKSDYNSALLYLEQSLAIQQQIGDIAGLAATLNNMGAIFLNQKNDVENATIVFWQSYNICQRLGSPNIQYPATYLQGIIKRIGEAKFQEIISKMQ
ncbi:tetratricopeptide repeat protein [Haliscomenobacter sp.]|uniref:tetratricopeptide repeat protein n=1 Tax=Haliscomenobacter sp. TaxID=2717303 RepID=UPI003594706D